MLKFSGWRIVGRILFLFAVLVVAAYLLVAKQYLYVALISLLLVYLVTELIRFHYKAQEEVAQFVESIRYRDFSRYFDEKHAPLELQPLRKGFNAINSTFKVISKEKETQYHYLQKILELVDTGILSYELESGEVVWMNESLKRMLNLPYLKTIHSLQKRDSDLYTQLLILQPGSGKIVTVHAERNAYKILLSVTAFQTDGKRYKLIAFQNVNEALDETESKAWQKLLSVMTHEIMNSIAPISSLANTIKSRLQESRPAFQDESALDDIAVGIETIKRRSEGLLRFAETYRNLNKITTLNVKKIYVSELFSHLHQLMQPTLAQKGIELQIVLRDGDVPFEADTNLLEQVLINLLVNSMEAVKDTALPKVILSASLTPANKVVLKISDNGTGMTEEVLDKIFIPFFSTKKNGSGIGLSLCKQIIMLHRGTIQVHSKLGEGTAFTLQFG